MPTSRRWWRFAEHVLQVYSACEQKIHQVLCVIGSVCEHYDYDSRVLLLLGKSMQAVGVTLQLVSPEAALVNKLGASASLPHRLRAVQLVLVDVARPDVFEGVRRLGWSATKDGFPRVLATIIERKGCAVPDEYLRSGRRSLKKDGTDAKLKARSRQRIDTQKAAPLHPDCAEARRTFLARFK